MAVLGVGGWLCVDLPLPLQVVAKCWPASRLDIDRMPQLH